ncbi:MULTISPECIES: GTP-binding protein [unclassified Nodularia (in: cyanobacteria)]|uniref:GTP-binding protein n=1 Tax=unclassified Nodularia (in: cyanobacteria) TaxID=2656917 RepID=UPI00187F36F0|nr:MULTISPECIES: GTP-binding protein [unclassified Nodularia (in: cyanobacteria)]MBE9198435.1 GTP-binding protein [Nodularia sp. LEGE 06071]MCC2691100.1 GTP-binding protein [Nodularia sp. LEGE 04288]
MSIPMITVVAGPAGCGKTTWICQQLRNTASAENVIYFSPGTGNVPIDQIRLSAEFPEVKVFSDGQEVEFLNQLAGAETIYIELGFYLELRTIEQIVGNVPYQSVAVLPSQLKDSEYHAWAEKIVKGLDIEINISLNQIWRSPTNGQVIDEDSLNEFWYELSHGAYGTVSRAKGIFDVADGRALYADFVAGVLTTDFLELDLPRHLEGRPQRFSGIETWGENLDESAIRQTLQDCYLSDSAIAQYQEQVKQILTEETIQ